MLIALCLVSVVSIHPVYAQVAPFVDQSKDPQSYVDRYNNEPKYKKMVWWKSSSIRFN